MVPPNFANILKRILPVKSATNQKSEDKRQIIITVFIIIFISYCIYTAKIQIIFDINKLIMNFLYIKNNVMTISQFGTCAENVSSVTI